MKEYKDKVIVVTGASSGIGKEIAKAFFLEGAKLALCSRSEDRVREAVKGFSDYDSNRILICKADFSQVKDIFNFKDKIMDRFGHIDIWVNNAGVEHPCPTVNVTEEIFNSVVDTNFRGYYFGCQVAAQEMLSSGQGGVIINIGSVNAVTVVVGQAVYAGTKAAISQITKSFAREWAREGIRVNCIAPGSVPTNINEQKYRDPEALRIMCEKIPMGRRGERSEIADTVLYIASDKASYITGQTIFVDGGLTLCNG